MDVIFEFEEAEGGRGWVFRLARLSEESDDLHWEEDLDAVQEMRRNDKDDEVDKDGYWAGFTQTHPRAAVIDLADEEDYWVQYRANGSGTAETPVGGGTPGIATPGLGTPGLGISSIATKTTTSGNLDAAADSILRVKILSKIRVLLRQMWRDFANIAEIREDVLEEKALSWLSLGREIMASHQEEVGGDVEVIRTKAKMGTLWELYEVLDIEDGKIGFWRLIEEAIRTPLRAEAPDDGGEAEQLGYWE